MEWKKLGEVCSFNRGRTITAKDAIEGDVPVIAGGQAPSYYHNESNRTGETIAIAGSGAYAGFVSYWNQPIFVSDAFTVDPSEKLLHKFLFYWLKMNQRKIIDSQKGAGVPHVHSKDIAGFQIPILTLSEQTRIVEILDTFTASIDNIKKQIAQRRKQYEYYRDRLLDLEGKEGVEMKTLPEISKNFDRERKPITSSKRVSGKYPYYGASGIVDYVEGYIFDGDYLLISEDGANLLARTTPIAFSIKGKNWVNNHAHVLQFKDKVTQKLVEIYLNMISLEPWINGAAQPKLNKDNLNKIDIPFPSLSEQSRIVSILDTFEASIANLEAQLKEREKQYEYYRNKLLTFAHGTT